MDEMTFGVLLRAWRDRRRLTQADAEEGVAWLLASPFGNAGPPASWTTRPEDPT